MFGLYFLLMLVGILFMVTEGRAKHWRDLSVQFFLLLMSTILVVSEVWEIPQLLAPYTWMRVLFELLSGVLY